MAPRPRKNSLAASSPTFPPVRLPRRGPPNAPAAPPTPPAHPSLHTHDAIQGASSVTIWTRHRLQRLKTHCKEAARSLVRTLKGQFRRESNTEDAATLSTITSNTIGRRRPVDCGAIQSHTIHSGVVPDDALRSDTLQDRTNASNTWNVPIYIFYPMPASGSEIIRFAMGRFDSQLHLNLMASAYAAKEFGLHFDNAVREPIGKTITDDVIYSVGQVPVRFAPHQDDTYALPSGDKMTLAAKSYDATFHVIVSDGFDVYIGHPTLEANGLYGEKLKQANPFRSFGSSAGPTAASSAQDEGYLERMKADAERLAVAETTKQQTQSTPKT